MSNFISNNALFRNDGTNQLQRQLPTLKSDYVKVDDRNINDFLDYIYQLSTQIRYFNLANEEEYDWKVFFENFHTEFGINHYLSVDEIEFNLNQKTDLPPHIVLLLAFLKLYQYLQNDLNQLTEKHLDFFYKDILGLKTKTATADNVIVIFELAKSLKSHKLPIGTLLDAGKDKNGKSLHYKTEREIVLNQAKVAEVKSIFVENGTSSGTQIFVAKQANSADGQGKPFEDKTSWRPFGESQSQKTVSNKTMTLGDIGFALSSPVLFLKEGLRIITLSIEIKNDPKNTQTSLSTPFKVFFSGEKDWFEATEIKPVSIETINFKRILTIEIVLNPSEEAIVKADAKVLKESYSTDFPIIKLLLDQENGSYNSLKNFEIGQIKLTTKVEGVKDLVVQNDESVVDASKPFMPFGSQPTIGSNFYIGSTEAFSKKLTHLKFNVEWHKLPKDLEAHYDAYFPINGLNLIDASKFDTKIYFLQDRNWEPLSKYTLFGADSTKVFEMNNSLFRNFDQNKRPFENSPTFNNQSKNGFVRFELTSPSIENHNFEAFGHSIFSKVYAEKSIALSKHNGVGTPPSLPQPPYTPQIKTLVANYTAEDFINPAADNYFWLIEPFGYRKIVETAAPKLFPIFPENGYLYLGLENFSPPQTISLLFQIDDVSVKATNASELIKKNDVDWSYLVDNQWFDIKNADVLADTTEGFQKAGIVMLNVGRNATNKQTLFPENKHWIRAKIINGKKADGAGSISAIFTQAISAEFVLENEDTSHLKDGLEAKKIKKLVVPQAQIKKIEQPFASFGGRQSEENTSYYTRISERIRHRNRLVNAWDYEHKVLEKFPSIFKVKCLPHRTAGEIELVVVPNIINKNYGNPLQPRCSSILLRNIEAYLGLFTSPFVKIKVSNPIYEEIILNFKISFKIGRDAGYYSFFLNDEIKRFLSPWAFEEGKDIPFDGKIYKSDLLAFVESQEYVDFVTEFYMYHLYEGERRDGISKMVINKDFIINQQLPPTISGLKSRTIGHDFVIGVPVDSTTPSFTIPSIIVSSLQHTITPLSSDEATCSEAGSLEGIGDMIIGLDFELNLI